MERTERDGLVFYVERDVRWSVALLLAAMAAGAGGFVGQGGWRWAAVAATVMLGLGAVTALFSARALMIDRERRVVRLIEGTLWGRRRSEFSRERVKGVEIRARSVEYPVRWWPQYGVGEALSTALRYESVVLVVEGTGDVLVSGDLFPPAARRLAALLAADLDG